MEHPARGRCALTLWHWREFDLGAVNAMSLDVKVHVWERCRSPARRSVAEGMTRDGGESGGGVRSADASAIEELA